MNAQLVMRLVMMWCVLLLPVLAWAQAETGGIAGVVRDTSGAVMPGVTVEAANPALIEKVRSGTTDSQGLYRIVELRPGSYAVTFTLPGFATFRRDGIELTTGVSDAATGVPVRVLKGCRRGRARVPEGPYLESRGNSPLLPAIIRHKISSSRCWNDCR